MGKANNIKDETKDQLNLSAISAKQSAADQSMMSVGRSRMMSTNLDAI